MASLADIRFSATLGQITTKPTKDEEPETVLQLRLDSLPSGIVQLMRLVGKSAAITVTPYQQSFAIDAGPLPHQLEFSDYELAKARTVEPPETESAETPVTGPVEPVAWRAIGGTEDEAEDVPLRWEAINGNGERIGLEIEWWRGAASDGTAGESGWTARCADERREVGPDNVSPDDLEALIQAQEEAIAWAFPDPTTLAGLTISTP